QMNPAVDAEIIFLAVDFLESLGLKNLMVKINTVGCPKCRPVYRQKLQHFFSDKLDMLCHDCQTRFDKNPMRILDCKNDADKEFMEDAPQIKDCLCDDCREHFNSVQKLLQSLGVNFEIDSRLVRGLDYYTKTAFEIQYAPLGAQSAVAGGGRYDGLIEEIGGNPTPAVGFAAGIERILAALELQNLLPTFENNIDVFIVAVGDEAESLAFELLIKLRRAGLIAAMDFAKRSIKAQMKQAGKSNAKLAMIIGEDEVKNKTVTFKNLANSEQQNIEINNCIEFAIQNVKN
ncbi:MAG: histidine--tRNA ligase, partial [Selenomonadaceae bacterium]|nr:histidine--tRNA ligase [Selenomonadaceae bacterium]